MRDILIAWVIAGPLMAQGMAVPPRPSEQGGTMPSAPRAAVSTPALPPIPVRVEPREYNFGTTNTPPSLTGTFTFQNIGNEPIRFRKPSTSCGCAVASLEPPVLPPGGEGKLTFVINLTGFTRGKIEKQIYVQAEGYSPTGTTLTIKADLVPLYENDPMQVNLGDMRLGEATNLTVRLWRTDNQPLDITRLQPSQPSIVAHMEPVPGSNSVATLQIAVKAEGNPRWVYERIGLYAANPTQEVASVPIYGRFVGDIVLSREEIYWAVVNRQIPGSRSFRVRASDPKQKLEIRNLTCTLKEVALTCRPLPEAQGYEVLIELKNLPAATTKGTISFETNMPGQPRVTVPLTINMLRF